MIDYLAAFLTGIMTGGLSCLAVQGGLLTSSIAWQVEKDIETTLVKKTGKKGDRGTKNRTGILRNGHSAISIIVFLASKLVAYTILGFLLGWAGTAFRLSPMAQGVFQLVIGFFMVGNALRMLNVHPIFRYFSFEPPTFITRFIRRTARKGQDGFFTFAFLGFLTILIPCGVTQSMMALALSTGNGIQGAFLMFAFTLGTSPVFFALAYLFTSLGAKLERGLLVVTAVLVLALGVISFDSGLNLLGAPVSISRLISQQTAEQASLDGNGEAVVRINVENSQYSPNVVLAKAGVPIRLELVTNDIHSCTRAFTIPALDVAEILPATGVKVVNIPPQSTGTVTFSCSMGMYSGKIVFQ